MEIIKQSEQQTIAFEKEILDLKCPELKKILRKDLAEVFHLTEAGMVKLVRS